MEHTPGDLEAAVRDRPGEGRPPVPLPRVDVAAIVEAEALARAHDAALFLRAHPRVRRDVREAEALLSRVAARVAQLAREGADLSALDAFETSGIGGTSVAMDFSWGMARWLARRHPGSAALSWDAGDEPERLAATLPRFLPLLEERALVDSGVDFRAWLEAALPRGTRDGGLGFLVDRFDSLDLSEARRGELWDALGLLVRWDLRRGQPSRTGLRLPADPLFADPSPLVARRDVSIAASCAAPPVPGRLGRAEGEAFVDAARAAIGVRYREIHPFTWGNGADAFAAPCGRGLTVWCCGVVPGRRLPLRAGFGYLLARNGVPIGYGDAYALGERLDLSFNVFYAFRDGESAFAYARVVAFFAALLGTRAVFVDPYQVGRDNEEAIRSGAFWFYRKLGFAPAEPHVAQLAAREEARLAARPGARTPAVTLRRLAASPLLLALPGAPQEAAEPLSPEAVGLAVQRRMRDSGLPPERFRQAAVRRVVHALGLAPREGSRLGQALAGLAPVLDLVPDLARRPSRERARLAALVRAKAGPSEVPYVRALAGSRLLCEARPRAGR